uniref:Uncharacterized protein n=1 Tax=Anopheles darlingi TaxID=43151 RepID=A0A2M4D9A1_ANODA
MVPRTIWPIQRAIVGGTLFALVRERLSKVVQTVSSGTHSMPPVRCHSPMPLRVRTPLVPLRRTVMWLAVNVRPSLTVARWKRIRRKR